VYYLSAVALIAILVFIHEFGHFIVAKFCGVHVPVFSFGFGRRLVGINIRGTDYRISALPFGGYVRMAGADPFGYGDEDDDELDDPSQAFLRRPVWQRLAIMAAGPAFNLALPVVVFAVLYMAGEPSPAAQVGLVYRDTPAHEAGVLTGDLVTQVEGQPVENWREFSDKVRDHAEGPLTITLERAGAPLNISLEPETPGDSVYALGLDLMRPDATVGIDDPGSPAGRAGLQTGDRIVVVNGVAIDDFVGLEVALRAATDTLSLTVSGEEGEREVTLTQDPQWSARTADDPLGPGDRWGITSRWLFVGKVSESLPGSGGGLLAGCTPQEALPPSPASLAGIEPGDRFYAIDGQPVHAWSDVLRLVKASMQGEGERATAKAVTVELIRNGELVRLDLEPKVIEDTDDRGQYHFRPILGVTRDGGSTIGPVVRTYYGPLAATQRATEETVFIAGFILEQLGKVVTREVAVEKTFGGPIEMMRQGAQAAQRGIFEWARLMGLLSISLGIINLLPVPVLDGGQILFYAVEGLRGRPLSAAIRERAQQVGVLFLVLLMMMVVVFDIHRWVAG